MDKDKEKLIYQITFAFRDVELGEGIGLREARGIEEQKSLDELKVLRRKDKRQKWKNVNARIMSEHEGSLHMMNADGMRFYLPAFMTAIVKGEIRNVLIFHLTNTGVRGQGRFATLSDLQRNAVHNFLKWCLRQELQIYDKKRILQSLDSTWAVEQPQDQEREGSGVYN